MTLLGSIYIKMGTFSTVCTLLISEDYAHASLWPETRSKTIVSTSTRKFERIVGGQQGWEAIPRFVSGRGELHHITCFL